MREIDLPCVRAVVLSIQRLEMRVGPWCINQCVHLCMYVCARAVEAYLVAHNHRV